MLSFKGGIKPNEKKELSKRRPIREINAKDILVFPMRQHIGKPASVTVKIGDEVLVGQIIGEAQDGISASVVSSVSGKVINIEDRLTVSGQYEQCVIIQNDYKYDTVESFGKERNFLDLSNEEIIKIIKDAGIVGLGGAAFPTHIKLSPKDRSIVEYVLINACECEPYLTSDYRLLLEESDMLIKGVEVILKLFPNAKGIICIEDNKKDAFELISKKLQTNATISCKLLKTKYPQGGERELIYAVTKRKLNSSMLPYDVSVLVQNVDTVISIAYAVLKSTPLIRKIITVTGDGLNDSANLKVRLGIEYSQLVDEVGGFYKEPKKIISGGPMMGQSMIDLNVPVGKNSSAFLVFKDDPLEKQEETNCINCGKCLIACPINLMPSLLYKKSKTEDLEFFKKIYGMDCIECGSCSYVCPAKKPLMQTFKITKIKLREKMSKEKVK